MIHGLHIFEEREVDEDGVKISPKILTLQRWQIGSPA